MHQFDPHHLENYLGARVPGFTTLDGLQKFENGQSNPTYRLISGGNTFVLRARPSGKLLKSAHAVDREFRVMKALAKTDVPVPQMFHLSGEENPLGVQFVVMEWVDGRIFWDPVVPDLSPHDRMEIYERMNATLAALHQVDPQTVGLADYGRPGNYFARQVARWSDQYRATATETLPDVDWLIDWLDTHMVADDGQISIVHGDFRIDNIIFCRDSNSVAAVLDWELSTLGHPMADLAYQCMQWRLPHTRDFRGLGGVDRASLGLPNEAEYLARYCARRGIDPPEHWSFYVVFSYFRLIAILQGILKRGRDGTASNPWDQNLLRDVITQIAGDARREALS